MSEDHSGNNPSGPNGPAVPTDPPEEAPKGVLVRRPWLPVTIAVMKLVMEIPQ